MKADPLYAQVADDLRARILSGAWKPGERIPSEHDLCERYHVSRITVRKGIEELIGERLLRRERTRGTFVNDWTAPARSAHFTLARSFTDEMQELGRTVETLWAEVSVEVADERLAHLLERQSGSPLLRLQRTRGTNGKPFAYFVTHLTWRDDYPLDNASYLGSLYTMLRARDVRIDRDRECLEAVRPSPDVQRILDVDRNQPILKRTRMTAQSNGTFREYTECYYIGSEYQFHIDAL